MKNQVELRMRQIGQVIQAERKRHRLTQGELAKIAGLGINFVSQAESGKVSIHAGKWLLLLGALGLSLVIDEERKGN